MTFQTYVGTSDQQKSLGGGGIITEKACEFIPTCIICEDNLQLLCLKVLEISSLESALELRMWHTSVSNLFLALSMREVLYNILADFSVPMKLVKFIKVYLKENYGKVKICLTFLLQIVLKQKHVFMYIIYTYTEPATLNL